MQPFSFATQQLLWINLGMPNYRALPINLYAVMDNCSLAVDFKSRLTVGLAVFMRYSGERTIGYD